ncbi:MAG: CotH kinase family protein [Chitinophagales bacterium]
MKQRFVYLFSVLFFLPQLSSAQGFYDLTTLQDIHIVFPMKDWDGVLDSLKLGKEETALSAGININGELIENAAIVYRGNSSFDSDRLKNPFNIDLNHTDEKANYQGYKTLKLANVFADPSFLREVLSYSIAGQYLQAPKANYAKVSVNEVGLGVYVNIEAINKSFLKKHFGSNKNALFKADPNWESKSSDGCTKTSGGSLEYLGEDVACYQANYELKSGDESSWKSLIALTKALKDGKPAEIEKHLDVDATLWYLALNNVMVNLSSYIGKLEHNYYLYQKDNGQFTPIIWDLDRSFGSFKNTGEGASLDLAGLQQLDPMLHAKNEKKPLISQLLKNKGYQKRYIAHIRTILEENFLSEAYLTQIKVAHEMIMEEVSADANKYFSFNDFMSNMYDMVYMNAKENVPGLVELMAGRTEFLKKHPELLKVAPSIDMTKHSFKRTKAKDDVWIIARTQKAESVSVYYRYSANDAFQVTELFDDGKHNDASKADGMFAVSLKQAKVGQKLEYYIYAENAGAASFSPARAGKEVHSVSDED